MGVPSVFKVVPSSLECSGPLRLVFYEDDKICYFDTEIRKQSDGCWLVTCIPEKAGEYKMVIMLGEQKIKNSPLHLNILRSKALAKTTSLHLPEHLLNQTVVANSRVSFLVIPKDSSGSPCPSSFPRVEIVGRPEIPIDIFPDPQGNFEVNFQSPVTATELVVDIYVEGEMISDSPLRLQIKPGPPCGKNSFLETDVPVKSMPSQPGYLKVHLRDEFGNIVKVGNLRAKVNDRDHIKLKITQERHQDYYLVEYLFPEAGTYQISMWIEITENHVEEISGSPFPIVVGRLLSTVLLKSDRSLPRLILLQKQGNRIRTLWIPCRWQELNLMDTFLLDNTKEIFQWSAKANVFVVNKAMALVSAICQSRSVTVTHKVIDNPWIFGDADTVTWWSLLGVAGDESIPVPCKDTIRKNVHSYSGDSFVPVLYNVGGLMGGDGGGGGGGSSSGGGNSGSGGEVTFNPTFSLIGKGELNYGLLNTNNIMLLDTGFDIHVWEGKRAPKSSAIKNFLQIVGETFFQTFQQTNPVHFQVLGGW
eukprot:TRINITY_DN4672_c0_g4_i8.p1 TRINITY_DN4672_c0_g4~~TRINITY_DN4672_c0_g4_i8.p1  ORF type:complete len:591 (-),score=153.57 TRINITY_DN4672_c0_g4_i8:288-1883(-)